MDLSVSPKDEIWFLRVCHHISTGLYFILLPLLMFCPSVSVGVIAVSGGFPRCANLQETLALVRNALVTKDGLVFTVNWLTRLRKRTFRTAVEATHGSCSYRPLAIPVVPTYVLILLLKFLCHLKLRQSENSVHSNRNNKLCRLNPLVSQFLLLLAAGPV